MDKVVFITGASRGIGAATAKKFASQGWKVAGFSNKTEGYYQMDAGDGESIKKAFTKAFEDMGRVDCLVNCAGILLDKRISNYEVEDMEKIIRVNEMGVYLCTKKVLEYMQEGSMVNISSTAAQAGSWDPVYAGTKGAVWSFSKSMALALAPRIRVNCVAPGIVDTDMGNFGWSPNELKERVEAIPMGRMAKSEEIAAGVYFLASDEASHITGACLDINGGYTQR